MLDETIKRKQIAVFDKELLELACGSFRAKTYFGCHVNRVKFFIVERDDKLCTENSGGFVMEVNDNSYFFCKLLSVV